jgi:hypothetical protein
MIRSARVTVTAAIVAVVLATAEPVAAHGPDPSLSGGLFGQNQVLEFRWRSGSEPPGAVRNAILAAAADSNASRASKAATFRYDTGGPNLIGYGTGSCGVNGLGCFTRTAPTGFTMWLREHGRVFDWGTLRWCQMQASPTNGCYDAETIALDEFGHVEILNHHVNYADDRDYTDAVVQTFSRTRPKAGWDMHTYGICDTATLQIKYDLPTLSSLYSRCLDLATLLSIAVDDTSIPYGGAVDFTSILKVVSDSDHGRLSSNPIGARTIRLQRRAVGATTWNNLATLTGVSPTGTYVSTLRLFGTADFRAVFSTPTNEGVRGDTSPTVRISVGPCTANCPQPITAG